MPIPRFSIDHDPSGEGSGFSAVCVVNDATTLTADAAVFSSGNVGDIVRMNGGKAIIGTM